MLYDRDAGFRRFLGADPANARHLRELCDMRESLDASLVMQPSVAALGAQLAEKLGGDVIAFGGDKTREVSRLGMALVHG